MLTTEKNPKKVKNSPTRNDSNNKFENLKLKKNEIPRKPASSGRQSRLKSNDSTERKFPNKVRDSLTSLKIKHKEKPLSKFDSPKRIYKKDKLKLSPEKSKKKVEIEIDEELDVLKNRNNLDLVRIIEMQKKKIKDLEALVNAGKEDKKKYKEKIKDLEDDNLRLIKTLVEYKNFANNKDWKFLLNKVEEIDKDRERVLKENWKLVDEIEQLKKIYGSRFVFEMMNDVFKIKKEVSKLVITLEGLNKGKGFNLATYLGIDVEDFKQPSVQIPSDINIIKNDLNKIFDIISDIYSVHFTETGSRSN